VTDAGYQTGLYGRLGIQLAELAARQHGVFGLSQLRQLGITDDAVRKRARTGRLHRIHRGVYALTPRSLVSREGLWMAAVLACGPSAALSHRSAAHLYGLRPTTRAGIDVVVPRAVIRRYDGVEVHRSVTLTDADVTAVDSIPVTTLARMILDLAAVVERRAVERVIDEADIRGMFDLWAITDQLKRNPNHPGAASLRAALGPDRAGLTDSELEELFVAIWWPTGLPRPQTRFYIDPGDGGPLIRADFAWPEARFDLETDGGRYHASDRRRRRDYRRDQRLKHARWDVLRVGDDQFDGDPAGVVGIVWELLARRLPRELRRPWP
jgi:predicted transcriptional regulator of viral defense system